MIIEKNQKVINTITKIQDPVIQQIYHIHFYIVILIVLVPLILLIISFSSMLNEQGDIVKTKGTLGRIRLILFSILFIQLIISLIFALKAIVNSNYFRFDQNDISVYRVEKKNVCEAHINNDVSNSEELQTTVILNKNSNNNPTFNEEQIPILYEQPSNKAIYYLVKLKNRMLFKKTNDYLLYRSNPKPI